MRIDSSNKIKVQVTIDDCLKVLGAHITPDVGRVLRQLHLDIARLLVITEGTREDLVQGFASLCSLWLSLTLSSTHLIQLDKSIISTTRKNVPHLYFV